LVRWQLAAVVVVLGGIAVGCATHEPDPYFRITARELDHALPPGSLAAQLTPAERSALDEQGYEIAVDEDDWDTQAALEASGDAGKPRSGFQRAMDHMGRATVAVSSVAMAVGMVVAPFFLF
jgi:hypothetical protein